MKRTIHRDSATPQVDAWVEAHCRRGAPLQQGVLHRMRIGPRQWLIGAQVAPMAVAVMAWDARNFFLFGHLYGLEAVLVHGAVWATAALALAWSITLMSTVGSSWRPTLLVIPGAVVRITENTVEQFTLADVKRVRFGVGKGGASVILEGSNGERHAVGGGLALVGGLTWLGGKALTEAIATAARLPAAIVFSQGPQPRRRVGLLLVAGTALFCITTGVCALVSRHQAAAVRELMQAQVEHEASALPTVTKAEPVKTAKPLKPMVKKAGQQKSSTSPPAGLARRAQVGPVD